MSRYDREPRDGFGVTVAWILAIGWILYVILAGTFINGGHIWFLHP